MIHKLFFAAAIAASAFFPTNAFAARVGHAHRGGGVVVHGSTVHRGGAAVVHGGTVHRGGAAVVHGGTVHRGGAVVVHGGHYRVGGRYYGGIWYGTGRHYWHGRWWAYGVGSCWRLTPIGYVWVCGY